MCAEPNHIGSMVKALMKEDLCALSEALKKATEKFGSCKKLAQKAKVSTSTILELIKNTGRRPTQKTLKKILKYIISDLPDGMVILCHGEAHYIRIRHKTYRRIIKCQNR